MTTDQMIYGRFEDGGCRFFECKSGEITELNVQEKCNQLNEFHNNWITSYSLNPDEFPKNVLGCGRAYIHFLEGQGNFSGQNAQSKIHMSNQILSHVKWTQLCVETPSCQVIDALICEKEVCVTPAVNQENTGNSPLEEKVEPDQDSQDDDGSGMCDLDNVMWKCQETSNQENGEENQSGTKIWSDVVIVQMEGYLNEDMTDDLWHYEGKELFLLALEQSKVRGNVDFSAANAIESIRQLRMVNDEMVNIGKDLQEMDQVQGYFRLALLVPTVMAFVTSLIIISNFGMSVKRWCWSKVATKKRQWQANRWDKENCKRNMKAIDYVIRYAHMTRHAEEGGNICVCDAMGRKLFVYDPNDGQVEANGIQEFEEEKVELESDICTTSSVMSGPPPYKSAKFLPQVEIPIRPIQRFAGKQNLTFEKIQEKPAKIQVQVAKESPATKGRKAMQALTNEKQKYRQSFLQTNE